MLAIDMLTLTPDEQMPEKLLALNLESAKE